ncbi:MAG: hypothetical protein RL199_286 [Pseudomonadota bacterium]|jgi:hypothetical protein
MGGRHTADALVASSSTNLSSRWVVDAPWPPRIGPLERAWTEPREAHALGRPLADFFAELVRRLDPTFVRDFPAPVSRPGVGSIRTEPRGPKGVAWSASVRRDEVGRVVERELVLWSRGVGSGELMLAWRRESEPGEAAVTHLELGAEGPREALEGLEEQVERMLSEAARRLTPAPPVRPPAPPPPAARVSAASENRSRRLAGLVFSLFCLVGALAVGHGATGQFMRAGRRDALQTVAGHVVEARATAHRASWLRDEAGLVAELTATYEVDGRVFTTTFVDPSLSRRTPSIVRALAERTWLGRDVELLVDPRMPELALRTRPTAGIWPALRLVGSTLLGLLGLMTLAGVLADGLLDRRRAARRR